MHKRPHSEDRSPRNANGRGHGPATFGNGTSSPSHAASRYVVTTKSGCVRRCLMSSAVSVDSNEVRVDMDSLCTNVFRLVVLLFGIVFSVLYFGPGLDVIAGANSGFGIVSGGSSDAASAFQSPPLAWEPFAERPLPSPPPESLIQARSKRWADEEEEVCRFPTFMNADEIFYNMEKVNYAMEYGDQQRKGHFRYRLQYGRNKHGTELAKGIKANNATGKKSITFLHIGKAGGSSLSCNIRGALKYAYHCPQYSKRKHTVVGFPLAGDVEGEFSKMVNCYVHYDFRMHCFDNPTLALNIRNPIDRLASWYHYEHIENMAVLWRDRIVSCGQQMLFKCYNSFYDLAEYGLAGTRPPPTQLLQVHSNASEDVCRHWAWATVQGAAPASFHNIWNYDWYGSPALAFNREIIVFRAKHNEEDWRRVDILLGGSGSVPSQMHANDASKTGIPVHNTTVSKQGHLNLCKALCHEIQVYKQLMNAAINLNEEDTMESLRELNCPDDMTPEARLCPQNYFDYFV